ncbi:anhydro-N-acetylmuramic acid kinase [Carboxylicivirga linearis]|uniref:Anhydro-N-acetylmuramic acid kinase n=1 Tax=Carboxylicivirga linearis TaxID=1628157 RepID=A0ABS5JYL2_9BACT|nr:anhydro-N-acetylmuramic acid kinase [Carboxylicivirga linearis]MBS2099890.1 anhydro-N-acetylmuramic acid kinase [Carboxylicivirga linearis]
MIEQINKSYCCVGLMSGTSLDGLDIAMCNLRINDGKWTYSFIKTQTVEYTSELEQKLKNAFYLSGAELMQLHRDYGKWLGQQVNHFLEGVGEKPDFIASHGHTIFHEPHNQMNFQLGDGGMLAATSGITVVSDFRTLDICLGGQGAPLVPVGDQLLFESYSACINLGGFANVSVVKDGKRLAWDICALNFVLNKLAKQVGEDYDEGGALGRRGKIIRSLLDDLSNLEYYKGRAPKSLGQEWVEKELWPIIDKYNSEPVENIAHTYYHHVAEVISCELEVVGDGSVLITGGGVYNSYLIELLQNKMRQFIEIPDRNLIEYKEALVFALLGALRMQGEVNCWSSVTGAKKNSSSGVIHRI